MSTTHRTAPLKRLIESAVPGAWGSEPIGEGADAICIRVADFVRERFEARAGDEPTLRYIDPQTRERLALVPDDVLLERSGDTGYPARYVGEAAATYSNFLLRLRPASDVDPRYLWYALQWGYLSGIAASHTNRTTMSNLDVGAYLSARMPVWPLTLQRAISDYLDRETARIHALIAAKRRMVDLIRDQFAAQRDLALLEAPGMAWIPLQHLTDPYRPIVYGIVQAGEEVPNGVPYIKTGDLTQFRPQMLSRTSKAIDRAYSRARVFSGDIVIAMRASIGLPVVVPPELPVANLTQGTARIAPRQNVNLRWLFHALRSRAVQEQCDVRAVGTTFRTLNIWDLRRINVPTPPSWGDQESLADVLDAAEVRLDELTAALHTQIALLQERRQALVTAAVSGQLPLPDAA